MAYSTQSAVSDGTLVSLAITIDYFDRSEISVLFDDVLVAEGSGWDWVGTTDTTLSFDPAVADTVEVTVVRATDIADIRHSLEGGAAYTDQTMDENFKQVLHIAQEAREGLQLGDIYQDLNMHGFRMLNIADPVDPTDAMSYGLYQADVAGAFATAVATATVDAEAAAVSAAASQGAAAASAAEAAGYAAGIAPVETQVSAAATQATPIDGDVFGFVAAVGGALKKCTFANLKTTLKAYFDTLYVEQVGVVKDYLGTTAPSGYVLLSGLTLGNAASGATGRANADTVALFTLLWDSMADAQAPVSTGRGVSAAADYAANKTITLPDARGRGTVGKDDMGGSAASRLTAGGSGVAGATLGAAGGDQLLQAHTHVVGSTVAGTSGAFGSLSGDTGSQASSSTGGGGSQNVQPSLVVNKIVKL